MHAYLLGDFQPQSGLDQEARMFQLGRDEFDMAEACDAKLRNVVRRTGASRFHLSIFDRRLQSRSMFSMPYQNTICRGIDIGFSDPGIHVRPNGLEPPCMP